MTKKKSKSTSARKSAKGSPDGGLTTNLEQIASTVSKSSAGTSSGITTRSASAAAAKPTVKYDSQFEADTQAALAASDFKGEKEVASASPSSAQVTSQPLQSPLPSPQPPGQSLFAAPAAPSPSSLGASLANLAGYLKSAAPAVCKHKVKPLRDSSSDESASDSDSGASEASTESDSDTGGDKEQLPLPIRPKGSQSRFISRYVDRFAPSGSFLRQHLRGIDEHGSFALWCRHVQFKKTRNERECLMLARCLDALLSGQFALAADLVVRRLAAVQQADAKDNWSIAQAIEHSSHDDSFVSSAALHKFFKEAERYAKLDKSSASSSSQWRDSTESDNRRSRGGRRFNAGQPEAPARAHQFLQDQPSFPRQHQPFSAHRPMHNSSRTGFTASAGT